MRDITLREALEVHHRVMAQSGGLAGIRDLGALESALAQPRMAFAGQELYPSIVEKAAALGFSLIKNHPFTDGNKRTGHAVMEMFLMLNGHAIQATVDEQVDVVLRVASGELGREGFLDWLRSHVIGRDL